MTEITGGMQNIGADGYPQNDLDLIEDGLGQPGMDGSPASAPEQPDATGPVPAVDSLPVSLMAAHLPQWLAVNVADDITDTVYYQVFYAFADALSTARFPTAAVDSVMWLAPQSRTYPRLVWRCLVKRQALERISLVRLIVSGDDEPVVLRQAASQADFLLTADPVFAASEDGYVYVRNIAQVSETLVSDDGTYQLSFTDLIGDEEVWVNSGGRWERLSLTPEIFDYSTGTLVGLDEGGIQVRYSTQSRMASTAQSCLYIDSEPPVIPEPLDTWNPHDEAALIASLSREPMEDNSALDERVRVAYMLAHAPNINTFTTAVGHELGLVGIVEWNTSAELDLTAAGVSGVSYAWVLELDPEDAAVGEILTPDNDGLTFTSAKSLWLGDWKVYISGTRVTARTRPDMRVHDGLVEFTTEVLGTVSATYRYNNYDFALDPLGRARISANANTPPGTYHVVYVKGITAYPASGRNVLDKLTTNTGQSTELYSALASAAAAAVPVLVGSTNWGRSSHWFDDGEITPQISHLPVPLK